MQQHPESESHAAVLSVLDDLRSRAERETERAEAARERCQELAKRAKVLENELFSASSNAKAALDERGRVWGRALAKAVAERLSAECEAEAREETLRKILAAQEEEVREIRSRKDETVKKREAFRQRIQSQAKDIIQLHETLAKRITELEHAKTKHEKAMTERTSEVERARAMEGSARGEEDYSLMAEVLEVENHCRKQFSCRERLLIAERDSTQKLERVLAQCKGLKSEINTLKAEMRRKSRLEAQQAAYIADERAGTPYNPTTVGAKKQRKMNSKGNAEAAATAAAIPRKAPGVPKKQQKYTSRNVREQPHSTEKNRVRSSDTAIVAPSRSMVRTASPADNISARKPRGIRAKLNDYLASEARFNEPPVRRTPPPQQVPLSPSGRQYSPFFCSPPSHAK